MMGWGYGDAVGGTSLFGLLIVLFVLIDLILLGVWLWKQVSKK